MRQGGLGAGDDAHVDAADRGAPAQPTLQALGSGGLRAARVEDEYWGIETLHKSKMGIIGVTGGLGEAIAARALGFGMEVYGVARTARETSPVHGVHSPIWGMEDVEKMLPLVDVSTAAPFALCVFFRPQKKKRLHSGWS